jgi:hypothetical protein
MIYKSQMPAAVFLTWLQLRGLAWCGLDTPSLCMQELVDLTGKSMATLTRHLDHLQLMHALRWHSPEPGKLIVTFPKIPPTMLVPLESNFQNCKIENLKKPPSLNPLPSSDSWSLPHQIPVMEPVIQESDQTSEDEVEGGGESLQCLCAFTGSVRGRGDSQVCKIANLPIFQIANHPTLPRLNLQTFKRPYPTPFPPTGRWLT